MKILRSLLFSILGLVLPIAVALAAYAVSARSFDPEPPSVTIERIAQPQRPSPSPSPSLSPATVPTPLETSSPDDRGGRCSEPEHFGDPECAPGGDSEDNSGPGGGGDSGSGSDNSGPGGSGGNSGSGSDNSGSGGGDD
jgi:hypothetical protein